MNPCATEGKTNSIGKHPSTGGDETMLVFGTLVSPSGY